MSPTSSAANVDLEGALLKETADLLQHAADTNGKEGCVNLFPVSLTPAVTPEKLPRQMLQPARAGRPGPCVHVHTCIDDAPQLQSPRHGQQSAPVLHTDERKSTSLDFWDALEQAEPRLQQNVSFTSMSMPMLVLFQYVELHTPQYMCAHNLNLHGHKQAHEHVISEVS